MENGIEGEGGLPTKTFGAFEARTHFANLLNRVENGEVLTITRNHKPVALLAPAPVSLKLPCPPRDLRAQFHRFQMAHPFDGLSHREMIDEGRSP